ncbi:unnamed protein product [Thlaspi arvense]|uniref:Uncharacterized protein n=1 Tax=Thlaspi arvense TaxID=13288 RepID=A0AAU9S404_THLAR|nr:unnamed protein product [Thlaspi arvense]
MLWKVVNCCWLWPNKAYRKLRKSGFGGPTPSFPLGNTRDMKRKKNTTGSASENKITHDLHSTVFPFYASWQKSHGESLFSDHQRPVWEGVRVLAGDGAISLHCGSRVSEADVRRSVGKDLGEAECVQVRQAAHVRQRVGYD